MENNYAERMALKTDEDLQLYLDNYLSYTPEAIIAAKNELERRGRIFSEEEISQLNMKLEEKGILAKKKEDEFGEVMKGKKDYGSTRLKWSDFTKIFIPTNGYRVTPILVLLNLLVFVLMLFAGANLINPSAEIIYRWGGNLGLATVDGEWWRLFTSTFIHIGILHLLMNMYALIYIGVSLEPIMGRARLLSAYILTGIVASVASMSVHPEIVSAGASGAIFGLFGVYLALLTTSILPKETRKATLLNIGLYVAYSLMYGMKEGIDNAAHLGGLVSGIVIGYSYSYSIKHFEWKSIKYATIAFATFFIVVICVVILKNAPNPIHEQRLAISSYQEKMQHFADMETEALSALKWPDDTPKEKLLYEVKERGIYYWNKCLVVVSEIDKLDIPYEARKKNEKVKNYCELRKQQYELIYKQVDEGTKVYTPRIMQLDSEIALVMTDLGVDINNQAQ